MTKMTYAQAIDFALQLLNENVFEGVEEEKATAMERLEALKAQLAKRNSGERKPTKTQVENDAYKATIIQYLTSADSPKSIKELQTEVVDLSNLTNQRITHMLTDLVKAGTLDKTYVKKTPYYSIVA